MKKSSGRREQHRALPAVSALKKEQGTQVEKHLVRGRRKIMAAPSKSHPHVKKLVVEEGVLTGKNTVYQPQVQVHTNTQEETFQGTLLLSNPPEPSPMPHTPVAMGQPLMVPLAGEPHGPSAMPSMCSNVILQSGATPDTLLLPSQGPNAFEQPSVSSTVEWQEMLEAAEALLALKNAAQNRNQARNISGSL